MPACSAIGMKTSGPIATVLRMRPARQRFDADDARSVRRHDRLVMDLKILAGERALELAFKLAAVVEFEIHARDRKQ